MAEREPAGPFRFDSTDSPEAPADLEAAAPDRAPDGNVTTEFSCPPIRRRVPPPYAARGAEYQESVTDR